MKLPWILFVSGLCANAYGGETQKLLGSSVDLFGTPYTCENGMFTLSVLFTCRSLLQELGVKPSITCTDPSSDAPNCSCTCTNGITFDQPLLPALGDGPKIALENCQADKDKLLAREQEVTAELTTIKSRDYKYKGCYRANIRPHDASYLIDQSLTVSRCQTICYPSPNFALASNWCWCFNTLVNPTGYVGAQSECSTKCPGNAGQICGGPTAYSLYSKTL